MSAAANTIGTTIQQLRRQLVGTQVEARERTLLGSGFESLDRLLPDSGLSSGSVIEWISDGPGLRTTSIALKCLVRFWDKPGTLAVVDPHHDFHAGSVAHLGIPLHRLLLVRPNNYGHQQRSDTLWALEQLARCGGVRVVLAWIDRLSSTAQRRLQLAVEKSGVTVVLIRPATALQQASWADLQFYVQSDAANSIQVSLLRCRNAVQQSGRVFMESDDETGDVSEIPELARSTSATPASR